MAEGLGETLELKSVLPWQKARLSRRCAKPSRTPAPGNARLEHGPDYEKKTRSRHD
jgi:hypothetical protein